MSYQEDLSMERFARENIDSVQRTDVCGTKFAVSRFVRLLFLLALAAVITGIWVAFKKNAFTVNQQEATGSSLYMPRY